MEIRDELRRAEPDGVREVEKFHHCDPSFAAFDPRNAGRTTEPVSERRSGQLRVSPRRRQ
jgi:hypothetical protein